MNLNEYKQRMVELCGDPKECKFPDGYWGNIRPWDYVKIMEHGEFKDTDKVLETGALHSYFCIYLSQLVSHYTCTDNFYWYGRGYAKPKTHQSPAEWCQYIMAKGRNIVGESADIQQLHYADNTFDKVICISTIEHVIQDRHGVEEMMRVVKPGGVLLMTTEYNPDWSKPYAEDDYSYYRVYDRNGIAHLLSGFNIEVIEHDNHYSAGNFTTLFVKVRKSK